jgi:hypothetical protein
MASWRSIKLAESGKQWRHRHLGGGALKARSNSSAASEALPAISKSLKTAAADNRAQGAVAGAWRIEWRALDESRGGGLPVGRTMRHQVDRRATGGRQATLMRSGQTCRKWAHKR